MTGDASYIAVARHADGRLAISLPGETPSERTANDGDAGGEALC